MMCIFFSDSFFIKWDPSAPGEPSTVLIETCGHTETAEDINSGNTDEAIMYLVNIDQTLFFQNCLKLNVSFNNLI